ncbi:MAG: hypothetical protein JXR83_22450 [Deltaproteobacteria bacterium]|nr:hypothetical protein [Deltaproteobacteria bacterium]
MKRHTTTAVLAALLVLTSTRCECGDQVELAADGALPHVDAALDSAVGDSGDRDRREPDAAFNDRDIDDLGLQEGGHTDSEAVESAAVDSAASDSAAGDTNARDASVSDAAVSDASVSDASVSDASVSDAAASDTSSADRTGSDRLSPTGLSTPCQNGTGWTLFRFHYDGSYSARIDVWDATCYYSLAPGSACNVVPVWAETLVHDGYALLVAGNGYIRVRFSANGLAFNRATVYVQADSYSTGASTTIEVMSPLYGSAYSGPVDRDWVFEWYDIDWTGYLYPDDDPDLTAIQIYAYQGSDALAVHAVELCVE